MNVQDINEQFSLAQHISFEAGAGDLPLVQIRNIHATATVSVYGAQVIAFQPVGEAPVIWLSGCSHWTAGKAIRGGIPLCWPWFGPDPSSSGKPQHGFVRTMQWDVMATEALADGATQLRLGLRDTDATLALWPHPFNLELTVTVGHELVIDLHITNTGAQSWQYSGGLHSYFGVDDVANVRVLGLEDTPFIDKVDHGSIKTQQGPVTISAETDRVYYDTTVPCALVDPGLGRRIVVHKQGSASTVVWNPWIEKARAMSDMCDDDYHGMLCLETTNAGPDMVVLDPGATRRLGARITVERIDA